MNSCKLATWNDEDEPPRDPEALWEYRKQLEKRWEYKDGSEHDFSNLRSALAAKAIEYSLRLTGLYTRGFQNATRPELADIALYYPELPMGLDGLQILMLSDLHLSANYPQFAESVRTMVAGLKVDLCLMPGDYRFGHHGKESHIYPQLEAILSGITARRGVYGVLGNHDFSYMAPHLQALGIHILFNEGIAILFGDDLLWLGGCDDPHRFKTDHLEAALGEAPKDAFKTLLIHTPCRVEEAHALGVDLYLCGHTHGGQIRFPGIGALKMNARCRRRFTYRQWRTGTMQGYTSPGLGTTDVPVRFLCPPEAQLITIKRGNE